MSELFDIETSLSPRIKWMRENRIETRECEVQSYFFDRLRPTVKWLAWQSGKKTKTQSLHGWGDTEDEAIVALAKKLSIPLWNEPTKTP